MTFIIMFAVYYLVITPINILRRFCCRDDSGRDPMELRIKKESHSYWESAENVGSEKRYFKPF